MKKAKIMLGLPGSGKTTFASTYSDLGFKIVSADDIRISHPDYDPKFPELLQDLCTKLAKKQLIDFSEVGYNILMDGGGINNHYTEDIILHLKSYEYEVEVIFIDTPVSVCIERNRARIKNGKRFVPESEIIRKYYKLKDSVERLSECADKFTHIEYFTNDVFFVDMDGVVAEYQEIPRDEQGNINFVEYNIFKNAKPVHHTLDILRELAKFHKIIILSASPNSICNREKRDWLKLHAPFINEKNVYFVGNKDYKWIMLKNLMSMYNLEPKQCTLVDDEHAILEAARPLGLNIMHISKFLTTYYEG